MAAGEAKVLLVVLDGLPARWVGPEATPRLHALAAGGAWVPDGGRAVMTTSTAPNLATFATGTTPGRHGITTAHLPAGVGLEVVDAAERGPAVATLFDAVAAARRSSAVAASRCALGLLGAARADLRHLGDGPPCGDAPDLDRVEAADDAVAGALARWVADEPTDLAVGVLRLADAAAHAEGPDSPAAVGCYRATDARLGAVVDEARARWGQLVVLVVSDHDQEPVRPDAEPVDLSHQLDHLGLPLRVVAEGGAALVLGADRRHGRWLADVPGVAGSLELAEGVRLAWARPGRVFGRVGHPLPRSVHGGPGATAQVAVVAGDHPAAAAIGRTLRRRTPTAADWAPTVADLLGLALPAATGRSLLGP